MKILRIIENALSSSEVRRMLVAVSGGADSVALLCLLHRIAHLLDLEIEAVNCNFHLRGEESDRDSRFVAELCRSLGITLHSLDYDVESYKHDNPGISTEIACRELRYRDFFRICEERHLDRVAVAHNADDDIETMMLNMLRGSGSRGLRGMDVDNGRVIRPLLHVSRTDIELYLSSIGQEFITDSSNLTSDYRRNFIRRDILPLLETRWPSARKSLYKTVNIMKDEADIVEAHYRAQLKELTLSDGSLDVYADGISTGTVLRFLEPFGGNGEIAEEILDSVHKDFIKRHWKLSPHHEAILERDRLHVMDLTADRCQPSFQWESLPMTDELMNEIKRNRNQNIVYLPHDASVYELRCPATGDRMSPLGMRGSRLLSDIISDAKLDTRGKEALRVLARRSDGEIIWLSGLKRSRRDLISPDTETIHKLSLHLNC